MTINRFAPATLAILAFIIAFWGAANLLKPTPDTGDHPKFVGSGIPEPTPPTEQELLTLINIERAKVGVAPLKIDPRLTQSAQLKSNDMFSGEYFAHENPISGKRGFEYINEINKDCVNVGENIVQPTSLNDSVTAVQLWMNSKAHRDAILDYRHDTTGFGIAGNYITEHFCDLP